MGLAGAIQVALTSTTALGPVQEAHVSATLDAHELLEEWTRACERVSEREAVRSRHQPLLAHHSLTCSTAADRASGGGRVAFHGPLARWRGRGGGGGAAGGPPRPDVLAAAAGRRGGRRMMDGGRE